MKTIVIALFIALVVLSAFASVHVERRPNSILNREVSHLVAGVVVALFLCSIAILFVAAARP